MVGKHKVWSVSSPLAINVLLAKKSYIDTLIEFIALSREEGFNCFYWVESVISRAQYSLEYDCVMYRFTSRIIKSHCFIDCDILHPFYLCGTIPSRGDIKFERVYEIELKAV